MKLCNVFGCNEVCLNCDGTIPTKNGEYHGDVCRLKLYKALEALEHNSMICYDKCDNIFFEKKMYTSPACYVDDDWEEI